MAAAKIPSKETTTTSQHECGYQLECSDQSEHSDQPECDAQPECGDQAKCEDHNVGLRIVLVGKTGSGKSSLGNIFLKKPDVKGGQKGENPKSKKHGHSEKTRDTGDEGFTVFRSFRSGTQVCGYQESSAWGRHMKVVDTPGLFDTSDPKKLEQTLNELTNVLSLSTPGPHAIIFVTRCDIRFTEEEYQAFKKIEEMFGKDFLVLVFTNGDSLDDDYTIDDMLKDDPPPRLVEVLKMVGNNYAVISKTEDEDTRNKEMTQLFGKIDNVSQSGEKYFSSEECQMMTQIIDEEIDKMMKTDGVERTEAEYRVKRSMAIDREGFLLSKSKMKLKLFGSKAFAALAELEAEVSSSTVVLPEASAMTDMISRKLELLKKKTTKKNEGSSCTIQ